MKRKKAAAPMGVSRPRYAASGALLSALLLASFLVVGSVRDVSADQNCAAPSGHGIEFLDPGDEDSGIGGTGISAPRSMRRGDDGDSGIGGTGHRPSSTDENDSGLGGTGLFGRITSVEPPIETTPTRKGRSGRACLNGIELAVPESLALESSDGTAAGRALAAGQLAYVEATRGDGGLEATRIVLAADRAGQIEVMEAGARKLIVSGERVQLAPDVSHAKSLGGRALRVGDWILYQAEPGPDGTLIATRLSAGRPRVVERRDNAFEDRVATWLGDAKNRRFTYVSVEGFIRGTPDQPSILGLRLNRPAQSGHIAGRARKIGARVRVGGIPHAAGQLKVEGPPRWVVPRASFPQTPQRQHTPTTPTAPVKPDATRKATPPIRPTEPPIRPQIRRPDTIPVRPIARPDVRPKVATPDRIRR